MTPRPFFCAQHIIPILNEIMPNVVDVFVDPSAGCGFTVHVAIKKARIGEPKMAMMRAYTVLAGFCKHVFVYDDDIDIRNPRDRDWALAHLHERLTRKEMTELARILRSLAA